MLTRNSRLLLALTVATPLLFAACTDNNIFNPMSDAAGDYQLTVYAGHSVPATFTSQAGDPDFPDFPNGASFLVTGGDFALNDNGTFVETNTIIVTPVGGSSQNNNFVSTGTWSVNGTSLSFSAPAQSGSDPRFVTGTLAVNGNNRLTINYQENTGTTVDSFEYVR